jgi:DNA-directed RNA polymerase specialized sigma24 family protein
MSQGVTDDEIIAAMPYVCTIASNFRRCYGDAIDWREEALLALVVAARHYRHHDERSAFVGFLSMCIPRRLRQVLQHRRRKGRHLAIPRGIGVDQADPEDTRRDIDRAAFEARDEAQAAIGYLTETEAAVVRLMAAGETFAAIDATLGQRGRAVIIARRVQARMGAVDGDRGVRRGDP